MVLKGGVEPPRPFGHTDLNRARLPIPPLELEPAVASTPATTECVFSMYQLSGERF